METVWKGMSEMEEVVLCGASAYNKKFYLNEDFKGLPEQIITPELVRSVYDVELEIRRYFSAGVQRNGRTGIPHLLR